MGVDAVVKIPAKSNLIKFLILSKRTSMRTQLVMWNLKLSHKNFKKSSAKQKDILFLEMNYALKVDSFHLTIKEKDGICFSFMQIIIILTFMRLNIIWTIMLESLMGTTLRCHQAQLVTLSKS